MLKKGTVVSLKGYQPLSAEIVSKVLELTDLPNPAPLDEMPTDGVGYVVAKSYLPDSVGNGELFYCVAHEGKTFVTIANHLSEVPKATQEEFNAWFVKKYANQVDGLLHQFVVDTGMNPPGI